MGSEMCIRDSNQSAKVRTSARAKLQRMVHAACIWSEQTRSDPMVDLLILVLFLISGAATGWLGVELLPERLLEQTINIDRLRLVLSGLSAGFGLLAGFFFQRLRQRLMQQVRTMPTDLLVSRAVGLILGLLVANLLLAPILLLPLPFEVVLVKPLAAVLSNVFFGVL